MKKYKRFSYKQMWHYASMSKSTNAKKWMRKIYSRKIKEAESHGDYQRANYLRIYRKDLSKTFKHKKYPITRQTWKVADSAEDVLNLALEGKKSKDGTKLLILDNNDKAVLIAYEGTELFDEVINTKQILTGAK